MTMQKSVTFGKRRYRISRKQYPKAGPLGDFYKLTPSADREVVIQVLNASEFRASVALKHCAVVSYGKTLPLALKQLHEKLIAVVGASNEVLNHSGTNEAV